MQGTIRGWCVSVANGIVGAALDTSRVGTDLLQDRVKGLVLAYAGSCTLMYLFYSSTIVSQTYCACRVFGIRGRSWLGR